MKKRYFLTAFLLIVFQNLGLAQSELAFEFDYARFNYNADSTYMEFYYELNPAGMKLIKTDAGFLVEAVLHVEMKNDASGEFFINRDWKIQNTFADTTQENLSKSLSGVLGFVVAKGNYSLTINAHDSQNPSLAKSIKENVAVEPFKKEKYAVSDIELANNIKKEGSDPGSIFYKNTLEIIPNPSMIYSEKSPVLFYYAELYNLILPEADKKFDLQRILYNSAGDAVFKTLRQIKQSQTAVVDMNVINLSKYPTDTYNLVLSLIDPATNQAFVSSKRFFFYNPGVKSETPANANASNYVASEFGVFTPEECDKMFKEIKYIAIKSEIDDFEKLDNLESKREYLFNFWRLRDPDPNTARNEYKDDYMRRVEYANQHFGAGLREGYRTDRGRVYLTYGEPDQKDYYPSEPNMKPYEVWFYNGIEGGVTFIFGDLSGFNNYELLHSTKRGEVRDDNYIRRLSTN